MVTCAVFLRLNSLLKLAVLLLAVAVYTYLIHLAFLALTRADVLHRSVVPQWASSHGARTTNIFRTIIVFGAHINHI